MRALSSTAVPSGSHRSMRLIWTCFWYFVTRDHHRGLRCGLLPFITCSLLAVFGMALSVRCSTCDAQLEALPKDSISSQLLDPVGVLTSTAVVLTHKLEQGELITRMSNTKRVMSSCTMAMPMPIRNLSVLLLSLAHRLRDSC